MKKKFLPTGQSCLLAAERWPFRLTFPPGCAGAWISTRLPHGPCWQREESTKALRELALKAVASHHLFFSLLSDWALQPVLLGCKRSNYLCFDFGSSVQWRSLITGRSLQGVAALSSSHVWQVDQSPFWLQIPPACWRDEAQAHPAFNLVFCLHVQKGNNFHFL